MKIFGFYCIFVTAYMQWRSPRVPRLPGQMVGVVTCYYKVNFDPGFEYLGLIFAVEVDEAKNRR